MTTQVDQNRGDEDGQLAHQATPKAVGHEADTLSEQLSCCGLVLDDDGFCHKCWEHCL